VKIDVVILAAGKGTRMRSALPKVMHSIGGVPMLQHVINAAQQAASAKIHIVVGHGSELVRNSLADDINIIEQQQQLGTGHAVAQALGHLQTGSLCLILYGDVPLISASTLTELIKATTENSMTMLTATLANPLGYGRIVRNNNVVQSIVEQKDASSEQLAINEINTGIMCIPQQHLANWLPALSNDNAQQEYYLTDVVAMAVADNIKINTLKPSRLNEIEGVNNKQQLAALERAYQGERANQLMEQGATLADPARIDIRGEISLGEDVYIDVNTVFEGRVTIGNNVNIASACIIKDAVIGDNSNIHAHSIIDQATVAANCDVGPFARLRPGSQLLDSSRVGNFVEIKNTRLGKGSKANHLSYLGDAEIGDGSNIGAGTITCNYDGANKFKTQLGDNVFIGSNSTLVAPLSIATDGFVGAGSTITHTVDSGELAVGRSKQRNIKGWKRPKKPT
jgi:bifunctional UDP-N-acetylglucosamine pyrophosphorylase/glucosamine-1-phosphate N-acetyltransferase